MLFKCFSEKTIMMYLFIQSCNQCRDKYKINKEMHRARYKLLIRNNLYYFYLLRTTANDFICLKQKRENVTRVELLAKSW